MTKALSTISFYFPTGLVSNVKKAELIEGLVHVDSPLRFIPHGKPHSNIITWLGTYQSMVNGLEEGIHCLAHIRPSNLMVYSRQWQI